jgi:hypothetical protein
VAIVDDGFQSSICTFLAAVVTKALQLLAAFLGNWNDSIIGDHIAVTDVEFLQLRAHVADLYESAIGYTPAVSEANVCD